jgi:EAL domain-containing protein (putative c-di-GMP-specific phosphodiesterase class I)
LAYLHQLPVNELKIDRSFINRLEGDDRDRHMVQAILSMAAALGLQTVAEGVEHQAQLDYLATWGCTTAQGYLFSPPRAASAFFTYVEDAAAPKAGGSAVASLRVHDPEAVF